MSPPIHAVIVRKDRPHGDRVWDKICNGKPPLPDEFLFAVTLMERGRVPPQECLEVLDGRYETYALTLGGTGQCLLCDFDTTTGVWTILEISAGSNLRDEAYAEARAAHGLIDPVRGQHRGNP